MDLSQNNKMNFEHFLKILGKSDKTIGNYSSAISGILTKGVQENIDSSINDLFDIDDPGKASSIKERLFVIDKYSELDKGGNNMYKIGIQHFIAFLEIQKWAIKAFSKSIPNLISPEKKYSNYTNHLIAIRTKPFILLAGISGTGKSRLVRELAYISCPKLGKLQEDSTTPGNFCMIEVKPNWHDSSELLGYISGIKNKYVVTPFIKFLVKAMRYPEVPFFVCLDEMNLAPVEQYFAEYLSVLETRKLENETIISGSLINRDIFNTYENDIFKSIGLENNERTDMANEFVQISNIENELKEFGLRLPSNVIIVGTVNMDDTTHQFSRKVIDRAMTIEMNDLNFDSMFMDDRKLNYYENPMDAALIISDSVSAIQALEFFDEDDAVKLKAESIAIMLDLDDKLKNTPFRVAYRVQNELILYSRNLKFAYPEMEFEELFPLAVDSILKMKVLPRIEGDEDLVEKPLKGLEVWSEGKYTSSNSKIKEMLVRLDRTHYTSYWP